MARIGVFGGSFNPPHVGHVQAVSTAKKALRLDRLLVIPAAAPPHKPLPEGSPAPKIRLELTELAMDLLPDVQVLDLELRREGSSYTSDTLRELRARQPGDELYLLMGTDMFMTLHTWHEAEVVCALATPVMESRWDREGLEKLAVQTENLRRLYGCCPVILHNEVVELSSTTVRRMIVLGAGDAYLPKKVFYRIQELGLYGLSKSRKGLDFEALRDESLALYDEKRVPHALGCMKAATELARRWGEDEEDAARAAILHDATKALRKPEQLQLCRTYGIVGSEFWGINSKLLHGFTAAAAAERIFGENSRVCGAIRWHTTGKPDMNTLEKIIYLADYIEPTRDFAGLDLLRELAFEDLDRALVTAMRMTLNNLAQRGETASDLTQKALDYLCS